MATVVFCLAVLGGGLVLLSGGLDVGDQVASITSMIFAGLSFPVAVYGTYMAVRQGGSATAADPAAQLDNAIADLAEVMREQWELEERARRVHDPFALPMHWDVVEDVMDHWQNVNGSAADAAAIRISGRFDDALEAFVRIPSRRLVVTGDAGSGKTVLAVRFALAFLAARGGAGDPLPVVFPLGRWDPSAGSLRDWMIEVLHEDHPFLTRPDDSGRTVARRLIAARRIVPVLDGFDEIGDVNRAAAIEKINIDAGRGVGYLLTSRYAEFAAAVRTSDVLTAAVVTRVRPLRFADVEDYLPLTTRRRRDGLTAWHPLLDRLRSDDADSRTVKQALASPLMVSLARAIYSDADADPTELLRIVADAPPGEGRRALEGALLSAFVPAVYHDVSPRDLVRAQRHLRFLARRAHELGTHDLAWWHFVQSLPRVLVGATAAAVIFVLAAFGAGFGGWFGTWPDDVGRDTWVGATLVGTAICGVGGGLIIGITRGIRPVPARVRLRAAGRAHEVIAGFRRPLRSWKSLVWMLAWVLGGTVFGVLASGLEGVGDVVPIGTLAGLTSGAGCWFVVVLVHALGSPVEPTEVISPIELLRIERRAALQQGVTVGMGGALVFWLMLLVATEPAFGVGFFELYPNGLWALGVLSAMIAGSVIWVVCVTVWGTWLVARAWLPLGRRLPWRIMSFLDDAHRRGVLRQTGGVHQFRHARLRDHLADV